MLALDGSGDCVYGLLEGQSFQLIQINVPKLLRQSAVVALKAIRRNHNASRPESRETGQSKERRFFHLDEHWIIGPRHTE